MDSIPQLNDTDFIGRCKQRKKKVFTIISTFIRIFTAWNLAEWWTAVLKGVGGVGEVEKRSARK